MDEFEKSIYVCGVNNQERSIIIYFKDDFGKEVSFTLTRNHVHKLIKLMKDFEWGDFVVNNFSEDRPKLNQVYAFDGVGNSLLGKTTSEGGNVECCIQTRP
jgi:hypothetical protein